MLTAIGPVTDYGTSMAQWMRNRRPRYKGGIVLEAERPSDSYIVDVCSSKQRYQMDLDQSLTSLSHQMLPPIARPQNAANAVPAKHIHSSLNKLKHPINIVRWTPEGRRCLTGSSSGEFTLWNGMAFNFETIMQVSVPRL